MADTIGKKDVMRQRQGLGNTPQGTGFTNIQKIIGANQGNKIGQAVVGGIQQVGQQAKQGVDQATNQFKQDVNVNRLDTDVNKQQSSNLLKMAGQGKDFSEDQLNQAKTFREGQYQGPTDVKDASLLAGRAAEAEQLGKFGSSEGGRQGLLQRFVGGGGQYNQGAQRLDGLLLGADGGAINQARSATQGLADQSARAIQGARAQGQEAAQGSQQFGQNFLSAVKGKTGEVDSEIGNRLTAATQKDSERAKSYQSMTDGIQGILNNPNQGVVAQSKSSRIKALVNSNQSLDPAMKQQLNNVIENASKNGLTPTAAINKILTGYNSAQNITKGGMIAADPTQGAKLNALARLAGGDVQDYSKETAFRDGTVGFDSNSANSALANANSFRDLNKSDVAAQYSQAVKDPNSLSSQDVAKYLPPAEAKYLADIKTRIEKEKKAPTSWNALSKLTADLNAINSKIQKTATEQQTQAQAKKDASVAAARSKFNNGQF